MLTIITGRQLDIMYFLLCVKKALWLCLKRIFHYIFKNLLKHVWMKSYSALNLLKMNLKTGKWRFWGWYNRNKTGPKLSITEVGWRVHGNTQYYYYLYFVHYLNFPNEKFKNSFKVDYYLYYITSPSPL